MRRVIAIQDRALIGSMQAAVLERFEQLAVRPWLALHEQSRIVARQCSCRPPPLTPWAMAPAGRVRPS
jgi:hypothetical protein